MKVQVTIVVTPPGSISRVGSATLLMSGRTIDDPDAIVASAARLIARQMGLGKPTPAKEGGRG